MVSDVRHDLQFAVPGVKVKISLYFVQFGEAEAVKIDKGLHFFVCHLFIPEFLIAQVIDTNRFFLPLVSKEVLVDLLTFIHTAKLRQRGMGKKDLGGIY